MKTIKELVKDDIIPDVDGFYYYFPKNNGGSLSAHVLRSIADILDEMNEPWEKQITQYFEENPGQTSEDIFFEDQMSNNTVFDAICVASNYTFPKDKIEVFAPSEEVLVFGDFVDEG